VGGKGDGRRWGWVVLIDFRFLTFLGRVERPHDTIDEVATGRLHRRHRRWSQPSFWRASLVRIVISLSRGGSDMARGVCLFDFTRYIYSL
jgi:hypothetical protein